MPDKVTVSLLILHRLMIYSVIMHRFQRSNFAKAALTFDIGADRLLINYDFNSYNNDSNLEASGKQVVNNMTQLYENTGNSKSKTYRNEAVATYQKNLVTKTRN